MYRRIVYAIMSYQQKSIKTVIDRINQSYFIPDIQRNYVWLQNPKAKKIEQLFDSLMRGYPIGAFLFWNLKKDDIASDFDNEAESKKLNFQLYKFIEDYDVRHQNNEKINVSKVTSDELNIVLDGQQRLTSLYIGLRGSRTLRRPYARANDPNQYEEKCLYLNLLHKPKDDNPDDRYMFEFLTKEEASKKTEGTMWFKVAKVVDFNNADEVIDYCDKREYGRDVTRVLEKLWNCINDDRVISFFEEKEKNLDKVLKIFIRVNSGGMQLSYSDLLMSLLTATFESDIRDQMEQVVQRMKDDGFSCFGRDQILKTCMLLSGCSHVFKIENFSKGNIHKIESNWDNIISYLYATTAILQGFGYKDHLSSGYIITIISWYLFIKKNQKPSVQDRKAMAKFVRIAQMRSYFTTSLDSKLSLIKELLSKSNDFEYFVQEMEKQPDFSVDAKYLEWAVENVNYGSPAVLPLLQLLYPDLDYGSVTFHIDHIYPKSKFNKKNRSLPEGFKGNENGLWNLQLLKGVVNESKNDKDPEEWLKESLPNPSERKDYLRNNYIAEDFVLDWKNLNDFESQRNKSILKELKKVFLIQSQISEEPEHETTFTTTHSVEVETNEELKQIRKRGEDVIKKYREHPTGDLAHFVRQCESSQRLEEGGLKSSGEDNDLMKSKD